MTTDSWNPDQYLKFADERAQPFFDLLELVVPVPGGDVVDLGCGTGELTARLHDHSQAGTTLGIDSSEAMLAEASQFAGTAGGGAVKITISGKFEVTAVEIDPEVIY